MLPVTGGALLVWTNIADQHEAEFNDWYNRQHLFERVSVSGVIRGRRFKALSGSPRYAAFYEAISPAPFGSAEYLASANNPVLRTQLNIGRFREIVRTVQQTVRHQGDDGAILASLRVCTSEDERERFRSAINGISLESLIGATNLVGATIMVEAATVTATETAEKTLIKQRIGGADWTIVIEGTDVDSVTSAASQVAETIGGGDAVEVGIYAHLVTQYSRRAEWRATSELA